MRGLIEAAQALRLTKRREEYIVKHYSTHKQHNLNSVCISDHLPGGDRSDEASLTPLMRLSIATLSLCSMSLTRLRRG